MATNNLFLKTKILLLTTALLPLLAQAQSPIGIQFEQDKSWQEIIEKAKLENKYVFVDCYTTWCGPCRFMSDSIFTRKKIGDSINTKFISVQIQMDTSKKDNWKVKRWYRDAHYIMEEYQVAAFPTYLFFSPEGNVVHKEVGVKGPKDFLKMTADALDPQKQYYPILAAYKDGRVNYKTMPYLANKSQDLGHEDFALQIASTYISDSLEKLSDTDFCTKENFTFITRFNKTLNSDSKAFSICYKQPGNVDSAMEMMGYSRRLVDYVITTEEISPYIERSNKSNAAPDWDKMFAAIKTKYNIEYASRIVATQKVSWYKNKKQWKNYVKHLVQKVELEGINTLPSTVNSIVLLNNSAWEVFEHSNDKHELQKALNWINTAIPMNTNNPAGLLDTKANILYKLGRKEEAISTQQQAIDLEPAADGMKATLIKMKQGRPTWSTYN